MDDPIEIDLNDDKTIARVNVADPVRLTTEDVDALIVRLAAIRSEMTPSIPVQFQQDQTRAHLHRVDHYSAAADPETKDLLLVLRNPGLGWLLFAVPQALAEQIWTRYKDRLGQLAQAHKSTRH